MKLRLLIITFVPSLIALILQWVLWRFISPLAFLLFHVAVFASALLGGFLPGIVSMFFSMVMVWYYFIPTFSSFRIESIQAVVQLVAFAILGFTYSWVCKKLRVATQKLKQNEKQFRVLAESIPQMVWIARGDGVVFWYNQRWHEYSGMPPEIQDEENWNELLHPVCRSEVIEAWKKGVSKGELFEMEASFKGVDETYRWFLIRVVPVKDPNGSVSLWFGTNTDIDQQVQVRKALQNQVQLRDEFSSIVSHELKTPLTSLKLQLQMLKRSFSIGDYTSSQSLGKFEKFFSVTAHQVSHLEHLIEDLLDVSRIQFGKFSLDFDKTNLSRVLTEVVDYFSGATQQAKLRVDLQIQENLVTLCDQRRIEQVFVNLISNAIKYAPGSPVLIVAEKREKKFWISVQDQGPGIPKELQTQIFERFERVHSSRGISGLGLGLFIVKQIVEAHEGTISVESEVGKGF